jgi:glycosyltransferase involved in cell wall biosynthesis
LDTVAVLLPAWQPEPALVALAEELRAAGFGLVLVVDDGSHAAAQPVFNDLLALGFPVLRHAVNLGKGRALKTGFNAVLADYPNIRGVITADADGQHTPADIVHTARSLAESIASTKPSPVLGVRGFDTDVPLRSRFGNELTRLIFGIVTGAHVTDTQTGLRGFPVTMLPRLMTLEGERYEYEMTVLTYICRHGRTPIQVPIQTVYIDSNRGSHFNPIRDSMRIYFVLARFYMSSIAAAALDFLLFSLAFFATHGLAVSIVVGRVSSLVNFALNRRFVFQNRGSFVSALWRYYALAAGIAAFSYGLIWVLTTRAHWNVFVAKLCIDTPLSLVSFSVQRTFIFRRRSEAV